MTTHETLFDAVRSGTVEDLRYFIEEKKADVNAKEMFGYTALHLAAGGDSLELVRYLVLNGKADIDARTDDGQTPLHNAARYRQHATSVEIVKFLVSQRKESICAKGNVCTKGNVCAKDNDDCTPLHPAAYSGNTEVVKILVQAGKACMGEAYVNMPANSGITPLHRAVLMGEVETVKALVSMGADVNIREKKSGFTPLDFAIQKRDMALLGCLSHLGNAEGQFE